MAPAPDSRDSALAAARSLRWRGRSGRFYYLAQGRVENFELKAAELTIVAHGRDILWVGSSSDVISDAASRARFRHAVDSADRVYSIPAPEDDVARMTMIWDLEEAVPASGSAAA